MDRLNRGVRMLAIGGALIGAAAVPQSAFARVTKVRGTWEQLVNCVPTGYDPSNGHVHCIGSSEWHGSWEGSTTYDYDGSYDPLTGDSTGVTHETFTGRASDGTSGTLTVIDYSTLDGATGAFRADTDIISGTEGFAGSRGHAVFTGVDNPITQSGGGTYSGRWIRPSKGRPTSHKRSTSRTHGKGQRCCRKHRDTRRCSCHPRKKR
jgi:hypothetical protein